MIFVWAWYLQCKLPRLFWLSNLLLNVLLFFIHVAATTCMSVTQEKYSSSTRLTIWLVTHSPTDIKGSMFCDNDVLDCCQQFWERKEIHARSHYKRIRFDTTACTIFLSGLIQDENSAFEIKIELPKLCTKFTSKYTKTYASCCIHTCIYPSPISVFSFFILPLQCSKELISLKRENLWNRVTATLIESMVRETALGMFCL